MKKEKNYYRLKRISDVINQCKEESRDFQLTFTSTSAKAEIENQDLWWIDAPANMRAIKLHNRIKKEIGDLHADLEQKADFYNFSGLGKTPKNCYCVDLNAAYLTVLKNEGLIQEKTYLNILKSTSAKNRKIDRLKAVGMFASTKIQINFVDHQPEDLNVIENPQNWVFWLACQKTTEAMQKVMQEMSEDFLCYWVDGIFIKKNPQKAVEILEKIGFKSKIEYITDLRKKNNSLIYLKNGQKKILFLPKKNAQFQTIKKNKTL